MNLCVLDENFKGEESTFIGRLHGDGIFDPNEFWKLYDTINDLSESYIQKSHFPKEMVRKMFKIHGIVIKYVFYHFDDKDMFEIKNIKDINYHAFIERFECLMENFGICKLQDSMFDDELR